MMEPKQINAGDSVAWARLCPGYAEADGWVLSYALRGPATIDLEAFADPAAADTYRIELDATVTREWAPGLYRWAAFMRSGADRRTLGSGALTVHPDLEQALEQDMRSHARRMLDAIQATLEKRATRDQQSYEIEGRRLDRIPIPDLERLRNYYQRLVAAEDGRGTATVFGRPIRVRLS